VNAPEPDPRDSPLAESAWFDRAGPRGFTAVGAVLGLAVALVVVEYISPAKPVAAAPSPAVDSMGQAPSAVSPSQAESTGTGQGGASRATTASPVRRDGDGADPPATRAADAGSPVPMPLVSAPPVPANPPTLSTRENDSSPTSRVPAPSYTAPSSSYSGGGTVHVRGYYRKNGTYVQPHTRSAPHRRR
jgi:hypothetical protein